ncbi:MAG TPA: glycosyltransferase family 4 protein [Baekduia sp.]|nr:glycosyltransferase family 4 protein [Baekduia sp.]
MRVAFAFSHRYPETVGGAQRYYWALTRELARQAAVTYLTAGAWDGPRVQDGVDVVAVSRGPAPRSYAAGLAAHLTRQGGRYDVVHCACFPPFAPAAALGALRAHRQVPLVVDWHEVLRRERWRRLWPGLGGDARWVAQQTAVRGATASVVFSALHERRLRAAGARDVVRLDEFLPDRAPDPAAIGGSRERLLVFAGRLVEEKRADLVAPVLAALRAQDPSWRAVVFGDGPQRGRLESAALRAGVGDAVRFAGFAPWPEVSAALLRASALLAPSEREGFGLVVLEAAAHGLPAVLVAGPDNAATELIAEGVNGTVCARADAGELAAAVRRVAVPGAPALARGWFDARSRTADVAAVAQRHRELHERLLRR